MFLDGIGPLDPFYYCMAVIDGACPGQQCRISSHPYGGHVACLRAVLGSVTPHVTVAPKAPTC